MKLIVLFTYGHVCMVSVLCTDLITQMLLVHVVMFSRFLHLSTWTHYIYSTCMPTAALRW